MPLAPNIVCNFLSCSVTSRKEYSEILDNRKRSQKFEAVIFAFF